MEQLRAAVIGVGYFGSRHVDKLARVPGVKLEYVVDTDRERAEALASKVGARATTEFRDVLGKVDLATVAVPTQAHAQVAETLLGAGVHLLVEKPLTATLEEADRVVGLAAAKGLVLRVGHLERFNPALVAVRDRITAPRFMECHRLAPFKPRGTDVDVVLDLMIHDLDIILSLVDSPVAEVRANGVPVLTGGIDIANARIEFANGCVANVTASRVSAKSMRKLRVFQPDCYVSIDFQDRTVDVARADPTATGGLIPGITLSHDEFPEGDSLEAELAAFVDAVRGRDRPAATGQDARRALELALVICHRIRGDARNMKLQFTKMQGVGNDFVVLDGISQRVDARPGGAAAPRRPPLRRRLRPDPGGRAAALAGRSTSATASSTPTAARSSSAATAPGASCGSSATRASPRSARSGSKRSPA